MGNYAIILALAGVVMVSFMSLNARKGIQESNEPLENHHFKSVAREASMTGLNWTVRQLVADTASWKTKLEIDSRTYGTGDDPKPYHHSTFETRVLPRYETPVIQGFCNPDTVDVSSIGRAIAGKEHRHEVVATYVRTCSDPGTIPPYLLYPMVSEDNFTITDQAHVYPADASANANIHSNSKLHITNEAIVEGFASQSSSSRKDTGCDKGCGSVLFPNDDSNGNEDDFIRNAPEVEIPDFVAADYLASATLISDDVSISTSGKTTIDFTNFPARYGSGDVITGYGTQSNPFIWYVKGDFHINAGKELKLLGHVMVVVEGGVLINADSGILTSSGVDATKPPRSTYTKPNQNAVREWISENMSSGSTFGIFAEGCYSGNCSDKGSGIRINGDATFSGQLFSNHNLHINGKATVFGGMATRGSMDIDGASVVWHVKPSEAFTGPAGGVELPDGIRLLSMVEF